MPWPLYPRERDTVPIVQEAAWASGSARTGAENLDPPGFDSPNRATRSESLYRLRYPVAAQLVEALRYKLEGRGFDSRWCH